MAHKRKQKVVKQILLINLFLHCGGWLSIFVVFIIVNTKNSCLLLVIPKIVIMCNKLVCIMRPSRGSKNCVKVFSLNSYLLLRHSRIDKKLLAKKWAGVCLAGDPQWASAVPALGELPVSNNLRAWDGKGRAASWTFRRLAGQPCPCGLAHSSRRGPGSWQVSDVASLCFCGPER